ncbi:hypothetical protein, partial [Corallococcus exiguus]
ALADGVLGHDADGLPKFTPADLDALLAPLAEPLRNPLAIPAEEDPRWGATGKRCIRRASPQGDAPGG